MLQPRDFGLVGRFLHWGLSPGASPVRESEYAEVIQRWLDDGEFRSAAEHVAVGAGLIVVRVTESGIVLMPDVGSVFRMKSGDFRSTTTADDRLLEGFVQLGIAASVFPRPEMLEGDIMTLAPSVSVEYVEETLRQLCAELEAEARDEADPALSEIEQGLYAGWRVYGRRVSEETSRRRSGHATKTLIQRSLDLLADSGMFLKRTRLGKPTYQPTFRYRVQVQEFSANRAFTLVQDALAAATPAQE